MIKKPQALQPPPEVTFPEKAPAREGDDDGMEAVGAEARVVTDAERREQLRAERRKRMAARDAKRAAGETQVAPAPALFVSMGRSPRSGDHGVE